MPCERSARSSRYSSVSRSEAAFGRVPAEVAACQFVSFEHAFTLAHGYHAPVEGELQRALGRLAAAPFVRLVD